MRVYILYKESVQYIWTIKSQGLAREDISKPSGISASRLYLINYIKKSRKKATELE